MYPDLHLVAYRRHEQELVQRLERRRVAEERPGSFPAAAGGRRGATATLRGAGSHLAGALDRVRRVVRDAWAPTGCCSAA